MAKKTVATAAQATANWKAGLQSPNAAAKYKSKVQAYNGNPMAAAASQDAMQKYLNRVQQSVTSGKRAAKLNAVPAQFWKDQAVNIGAPKLSAGATKGESKYNRAATQWQTVWQQASDAAQSIPHDGSASSAKARVNAVIDTFMQAAGRA